MMLLGLDKTYKKEKKDRRFAQFNLILGAAADAGKREFNFTTRDKTRNKNVPVIKSLKDF